MKPAASKRLAQLRDEVRDEQRSRDKKKSAPRPGRRKQRRTWTFKWQAVALTAAKFLAIVALPFLLYVRTSVFLYNQFGGAPWLAVAGGLAVALGVVTLYATWLAKHVVGIKGSAAVARRVAAPIAGGWLLYSLLVLARVNAKTDDVRSWYSSLHPVLRVAVSTAIIMDRDMVVTDMQRVASDYPKMGLPINRKTRHYVQADGWVHAVDLRTNGRSELRNRSLQFYFWSMGFSTTRHVGTADHLHVQLK